MTPAPTPKLLAAVWLAAAPLTAGVLLGRPALVALGAPFAVLLAAVAALPRPAAARVAVRVEVDDVVEGETFDVEVDLRGAPGATADVTLDVPAGLEVVAPGNPVSVRLDRTCRFTLRAVRWGRARLGAVDVRTADPLGARVVDVHVAATSVVRVRPDPERLRALLRPARTQLLPGDHPAPVVGAGADFAGLRPARPGDRVRDLSWRATARRGTPLVVERHPDRAADVVLLLDAFGEEGLDDAVRCCFALGTHHLRHRDRVGLVRFGGTSRWVRPGTGLRHLHELTEALVATEIYESYAEKRIDIVPPRMLPAGAFVLAVSPLEDERMLGALVDLRRRGIDVAAVEVGPARWLLEGGSPTERLGEKLWALGRASLRARFDAMGVPVVAWAPGEPIDGVVARLGRMRRAS